MYLVGTVVDKYLGVILVDIDKFRIGKEDTAQSVVVVASLVPYEEVVAYKFLNSGVYRGSAVNKVVPETCKLVVDIT